MVLTQDKEKKAMKYQPNRLGTMIDCSRNAVASVESVKKWIDLTSSLGYNTLMLYTEDTYEVPGELYFGYMRGRYSREELRGLDAYAKSRNMELIPCIQTLAHLNALNRWPEYKEHFDVDDILLAQDERVYLLIDGVPFVRNHMDGGNYTESNDRIIPIEK